MSAIFRGGEHTIAEVLWHIRRSQLKQRDSVDLAVNQIGHNVRFADHFRNSLRQASRTADENLREAIERIDAHLGDGYAARHPELVVGFMHTAAADFHTAIIKVGLQDLRDSIGYIAPALDRVAERQPSDT